jgi:hypothetical protein
MPGRSLLQRSALAEIVGVDEAACLLGAETELMLSLPYCQYLMSTIQEAVERATDASAGQPHLNKYTVFAETWHATSLARLSDADIANALRLSNYLLLDTVCLTCLEDVATQRQVTHGALGPSLRDLSVERLDGSYSGSDPYEFGSHIATDKKYSTISARLHI